ncbi:alpha-2-macroglobulin isoform X3 [Hyalella azteca]|uniref:Alpha-2-macroglobulin isoform X3 n=1 Tax=Hyalella azteca TaxID=294128 RepID=A0A8B7PLF7_HYAAZ|nr:alpha-2-macroglobulin isoform X3 [Hyalella azteca]
MLLQSLSGGVVPLLFLCVLQSAIGGYLLTWPRKWSVGARSQICIALDSPAAPDDAITMQVIEGAGPRSGGGRPWFGFNSEDEPVKDRKVLIADRQFKPHGDSALSCDEVQLPATTDRYAEVRVNGRLAGVDVNETRTIRIQESVGKVFIQTDKYLYKAAQKVQFRVLTLLGPFFKVSTLPYKEIFIETPSGSRIAQWLDVANPSGLIHLDLQLIDEPEEGTYNIVVQPTGGVEKTSKSFKIEDYVLPRFEVTLKPPPYILADAKLLKFEVCAQYTFGQPVRGNVSLNINNNAWGRYKVEMNFQDQLVGCKTLEIPLRSFDINSPNYYAYSMQVDVKVEEEGTGVVIKESTSISITRTVLTFKNSGFTEFKKPELPYTTSFVAEFPDGRPAANEPMTVCAGDVCRNITTDATGRLQFSVPPHLHQHNAEIKAVNYPRRDLENSTRAYMYESQTNAYATRYFSPTNSSLLINPENRELSCTPGSSIQLQLPVMYAFANMTEATLYVQVVSRGQIQFWDSQKVKLTATELPIDAATLLAPMQPPLSPFTKRGALTLPLTLPSTVSPTVYVLVWYTRDDGEVVSDSQELKISKCLNQKVGLSWPKDRVEQGTQLPLTLTAQPNSLCSLGIVDKSVELLSASQNSLTLDAVFELAEQANVRSWEESQIDNNEYCRKLNPPEANPADPSPPGPIPIPLPRPVPFMPADEPAQDEPIANSETPEKESGKDDKTVVVPGETPSVPATAAGGETTTRSRRSIAPWPWHYNRYNSDMVDALKMFDEAGLFVISDLKLETRPCQQYQATINVMSFGGGIMSFASSIPSGLAPDAVAVASPQQPSGEVLGAAPKGAAKRETRSYFPETWLWKLQSLSDTGSYTEDLTLPDTITEWIGKAVCVHPDKGLGISDPASVTTFTPFFIDLTLLPSVKMGEVMPVKISVFNYLENSLPVRVTLEPSPEYEMLGESGAEAAADQAAAGVRSVCIPSQDKQTVVIRVRPLAVGDVNLTVSAAVDAAYPEECGPEVVVNKADRIIKPIAVDYEGFPREKTWTKYICSEDAPENQDHFAEWRLEAPDRIVNNSARAWITAAGDLLGPTLENLGQLIKMPYGCGEQNMLNFAPNIYVMQYLAASNQGNDEVNEKLVRFMQNGYQRELNYKHRDGSYSAFGESDDSGSTWLTAFVVKSFAQARPYISVDATELAMSSDWLKSRQLENGCFESVGKVLHKGMKGGLAEGGAADVLSAYVMAALLEAGEEPTGKAIAEAVTCIEAATAANTKGASDVYLLALKAYAYSLARLPQTEAVITDLIAKSTQNSAGVFWDMKGLNGKDNAALAVETTSYALLAMLNADVPQAQDLGPQIVKWISSMRNSQGGFVSTQDTVLALQALALYESHQTQEPLDLSITAVGQGLSAQFKVTEKNKLLTQRAEVDVVPNTVTLDLAGTGCSLVQAVVRYNVREPLPSEAFTLSVSTSIDYDAKKCDANKIKACASYLLNDLESNMAVIEVTLVSGYIPDKKDLKRIVGYGTGVIKRYEVDGSKVLFYIDQFSAQETCVEFTAIREAEVENAKAGTVKVYDYYEPELVVSETYEFERQWSCNNPPIVVDPVWVDDIVPEEAANGAADAAAVTDQNAPLDGLLDELDKLP